MLTPPRFWAFFDLVVTGLLAIPATARILLELLYRLSGRPMPLLDSGELLFVCLGGALGVVWALGRLQVSHPSLTRIDVLGRVWVAMLIAWSVYAWGAPSAILLFTLSEVVGAVHQGLDRSLWTSPA